MASDRKIRAICKQPGRVPYVTSISNNLANWQRNVGGYIETVTITCDTCIICNEEGRINGMPYNCTFVGAPFYGPIYFVGTRDDDFDDFPLELKELKKVAPYLWEVS